MSTVVPHITICICTYKRPSQLSVLLSKLPLQVTNGEFTFSLVVVDNDNLLSGRQVVSDFAIKAPFEVDYCSEPERSISLARNRALAQADGEAIAFIDDDEFPEQNWLFNLYRCWRFYGVAGILGPVRPYFDQNAPAWIRKARVYDRPEHETGFIVPWQECRTGNVLFEHEIVRNIDLVFRPEFGTGGGDVDFFRRMMVAGHSFVWCNDAVVWEVVPPRRWKRTFLVSRALLRGGNSLLHPTGRWKNVAKAAVAVPAYLLALPFLQLAGHHLFMRYLVKLCDHLGRLLALAKITLVKERQM